FLKLTRQTYVSHFEKYNPVTTEIAKQYDSETGPGPQGANQFQLYFGDGWRGSQWNLGVVRNMTSFALANRADQHFEGSLSTEAIHAIIWGHILQARDSWTQWKPCMHEEERDRFETAAQATTRAQIDQVKRYKSVHKANCKQKLNKREDGVKKLITHSSKPEEKKKWKRVEAVLGDLGELGQSLDDTDVEVEGSALVTTEPYGCWRFLSCILADLNASINELQLKIAAQHGKKHLAHPLQIYHRTGRKTQPKAIIGLPQSLYHH
ncbi:hypothetical protein BT96DRAFT_1062455, partial [Gymnopus androsaceus JB14]